MEGSITGLTTGFVELDNKTSGMQAGDLIIVAARPSMGKTTFAMNLVESVLFNNDLPALVYSMEMPADSIAMRLISALRQSASRDIYVQVNSDGDEWSKVTRHDFTTARKSICISMTHLPCRLRKYVHVRDALPNNMAVKLGCIMVDYLQLMKVPGMGDNRVGEISEISRSLKALAKEMQLPCDCFVTAQPIAREPT